MNFTKKFVLALVATVLFLSGTGFKTMEELQLQKQNALMSEELQEMERMGTSTVIIEVKTDVSPEKIQLLKDGTAVSSITLTKKTSEELGGISEVTKPMMIKRNSGNLFAKYYYVLSGYPNEKVGLFIEGIAYETILPEYSYLNDKNCDGEISFSELTEITSFDTTKSCESKVIEVGVSPTEALLRQQDSATKTFIENLGFEDVSNPGRVLVCGQGFPSQENNFTAYDYYDYVGKRAFHIENEGIEEVEGINFSDYDSCISAYRTSIS